MKRKRDKELFKILDKKTKLKWKRFSKYFENDSKKFINKISRDYEMNGKFPVHVLKQIKEIPKSKYYSAVCVLRGALPYSILFEAEGWKIHYVICGRKNEDVLKKKRFNKSVDKSLKQVTNKKILILENNSPSGDTPTLVRDNLIENFNIKKPDLFLDYFIMGKENLPKWLSKKGAFWKTKKKLKKFGKVYESVNQKVSKKEHENLVNGFLEKVKKL
ncbi:MAG: hypothetical protein U9Q06_02235 [Nanoarchaeota archaeon]|nr:hypothetical protein [Nanoarchaeota archaeon]